MRSSHWLDPYGMSERRYIAILILVALAGIRFAIQVTGGTPNALGHMNYVPIVLAAHFFGTRTGAITAAIAGVLIAEQTEGVAAYITRLAIYIGIGVLVGEYSQRQHRQIRALLRTTERLERALNQTVGAFVEAIEAKHPYTADHALRVGRYAVAIAQELGLNEDERLRIQWAARLHDVGKIGVPRALLEKPGKLSEAEKEELRQHPVESEQITQRIEEFSDVRLAVRGHHEHWNGCGYPDGLRGEEIHPWSRILAVADAWDAMTSDRSYRKALSEEEARSRLLAASGQQFDPVVVEAFMAARERHERQKQAMQVSQYSAAPR